MARDGRPWFRRPFAIVGVIVGVLALAWLGYFLWNVGVSVVSIRKGGVDPLEEIRRKSFEASIGRTFANANVTPEDVARVTRGTHPTLGNPDASLVIVEFADWDCAPSKKVAPVVRSFMERHRDDAYLIVRDFPISEIHPQAEAAAVAARCVFRQGNPDVYWKYHDLLYEAQGRHADHELRGYAKSVGADLAAYDACVASKATLSEVRASLNDGIAAGVRGTPTFFFNGVKIQGAIDADSFEIIAREARERASAPKVGL